MPSTDNAQRHTFTVDESLILKDEGSVAVSAAATVGGNARVVDLGDAFVEGQVLIDVLELEFDTANEKYEIMLQFSDGPDFSSDDVFGVGLHLGDGQNGYTDQTSLGQRTIPFNNRGVTAAGAPKNYRYMRLYTVVSGTVVTGINYTGQIVKLF